MHSHTHEAIKNIRKSKIEGGPNCGKILNILRKEGKKVIKGWLDKQERNAYFQIQHDICLLPSSTKSWAAPNL